MSLQNFLLIIDLQVKQSRANLENKTTAPTFLNESANSSIRGVFSRIQEFTAPILLLLASPLEPVTFTEELHRITHQLAACQGVHQLGVLTGEDGASQIQHHAHSREQHEKGDLETKQSRHWSLTGRGSPGNRLAFPPSANHVTRTSTF